MHLRTNHMKGLRSALAIAGLALWGCVASPGDGSSLEAGESGLRGAAKVTITGSAAPTSVSAGQEVDITLNVTTTKDVQADIQMKITPPGGGTPYTGSWSPMLTPTSPTKLVEPLIIDSTDPVGTYTVSVTAVRSGGTTVLFNSANLTTFNVTSGAVTSATEVSLWPDSTVPANAADADNAAVELGVKFKATTGGKVTGIRFYKGSTNTGTHVGSLWSSSGTKLATATFTNETATGWQSARFSSPVTLTANTVYVASYYAPNGHYAAANNFFASSGLTSGPLYALKNGESGGNGVYHYGGGGGFPTDTYASSNYYVDVLFQSSGGSTPPPSDAGAPPPATDAGSDSGSTPPPSGTYSCVQTDAQGKCFYPAVPYITGVNGDPYINQNIWAGTSTYKQTLYANSPRDWYVTANANTNFGGVLTYPNVGFNMTGTIDGHAVTTSSWSTTMSHGSNMAAWAAYDLWFNNWADEVMIQVDIAANSYYNCTAVATATFGGMPWHMCQFGSERVWKPGTDDNHLMNMASGSLDIKPMLVWMEQHGFLPANSTWTASSFGFEVCDTGGMTEKLAVTNFSWGS